MPRVKRRASGSAPDQTNRASILFRNVLLKPFVCTLWVATVTNVCSQPLKLMNAFKTKKSLHKETPSPFSRQWVSLVLCAMAANSTANSTSNSTAALGDALRNSSLGVGFSGSGALILYFTGVTAVLRQLGIITSNTSLAGSSGGAANAVLTCSNVPLQQQYGALTGLASRCRAANNCRGFLDTAFGASLSSLVPSNASELCSGRLWVAATAAKPNGTNDTAVLLGSRWNSSGEIVAAAQVSSYLPGISSPSATKLAPELPNLGPAYDGGFSDALPCPPDAAYCVKVAPVPYTPGVPLEQDGGGPVITLYNQLASSPATKARSEADPATGPFLPLNPTSIPAPAPDIFPGLSKPLPVNVTEWNSWSLNIPDNTTLEMVFDMGRQDAAFWASTEGLASAADATKALQATALSR